MRELVMGVINISGQAAIIFVVLLAVRGIFALVRAPKKYAYGLWAILFIRLLLPIQLEARWGLMPQESGLAKAVESMVIVIGQGDQGNSAGNTRYAKGQDWQSMFESQGIPADWYNMLGEGQDAQIAQLRESTRQALDSSTEKNGIMNKYISHAKKSRFMAGSGELVTDGGAYTTGQANALTREITDIDLRQLSPWTVIVGIWITGVLLPIGYGLFSYFRLKRKLRCSLRLEGWGDGIYLADGIETPFVLGFIAPRIYLPSDMTDRNYRYVIAHERIHIQRRDYLFKLGAYLLTCLYWFHPLVWAGFILMGRDMEMSCDEAVLCRMGGDCRREYADSLLELSCGGHYPAAAPLAFGEGNTRGRIKHIMGYRKAAAAVAIAAVALTGILTVVLLASPREAAATGRSLQDSASMELTEGLPLEESSDQELTFQVAYREVVSRPVPVMTGGIILGADGAILDYVGEDKVIFHGCFGLYVYSASTGETVGAVDLRALGCGDTQGDNTCQVLVSRDGSKVYFYPLGGLEAVESSEGEQTGSWHRITSGGQPVSSIRGLDHGEQGHTIYSYVYDVASGKLQIASWSLGQSGDSYEEIEFSQLMGEELSECRAIPMAELEWNTGDQGFFSWYGMVFEREEEQNIGYLISATGTLEDLMYVQIPAYGDNRSFGQKLEAVQLFGANGQGTSKVSYGRDSTQITIDGTTYDLCQVMTEYRLGDEMIESPQGNDLVNAIVGLQCMEGLWIVEGHINPDRSTYSFYDPASREWMCHIVGTCLTWSSRDERVALWEGSRESLLSTVIYALDNNIYSLRDGLLDFMPWEQAGQGETGLSQEEIIYGLYRQGDEITVEVISPHTQERRTVQFHYFHYESSRSGVIKLE